MLDDANHGDIACVTCHDGDPTAETRALAHVGLKPDPSWTDTMATCGGCHQDIAEASQNSLHTTLLGEKNAMLARTATDTLVHAGLDTTFTNHCSSCHSTCGNCHISVPASAGGGLLRKHLFVRTPPTTMVCTACHGSRVGDEYKGLNSGYPADVHYNRGLACTACHSGEEMHGQNSGDPSHRYAVTNAPRCQDCHEDDDNFKVIPAHDLHRDEYDRMSVSCQVCHSVTYKNCSSCHANLTELGTPIYEVNAPDHQSEMTFKIGYNPLQDDLHPERWVVLRHVPADPENYDIYGENLQPGFQQASTWRMATPHNIQKSTPQNAGCMFSCHAQRDLFLSSQDLADYEVEANQSVIVPDEDLPQLP